MQIQIGDKNIEMLKILLGRVASSERLAIDINNGLLSEKKNG